MATTNQSLRQPMLMRNKSRQALNLSNGFTLVEVMVIAPVVILVIGGFVGAIIAMTGNVLATRSANKLVYNVQDALNRIETDVAQSGGFLFENNIAIQSPQGSDDDTAKFEANSPTLILNSYATDKNPIDDRHVVLMKGGSPLMAETVYFVVIKPLESKGTLWRRVITPAIAGFVSDANITPWQQPSCTAESLAAVTGNCKVKDMRLVDGIEADGFKIEYLDSSGSFIDTPVESDMTTYNTIKITITAKGGAAGREYSETGTIRATRPK